MQRITACLLVLLARGLVISAETVPATAPQPRVRSKEAYVTLLYGDDFLLGVRVLGQSLRQSATTR